MAVVSRIATLQLITTPDTGTRTWIATAAVQDTAAGSSVSIDFVQNRTGATPPTLPTSLTLALMTDNSQTAITTFTITPSNTSGTTDTLTFHFTNDGTSGGTARSGTLKLKITAAQTGGVVAQQYNVNTDNNPADSFGTGSANSVGQRDQGWIRGTTTLTESISNIALGGGKTQPAQYNESLFIRTTSGAASYTARALLVALSAGGVSGFTSTTTSATRDFTIANIVDDRFPAAVTSVGMTVTVPNASLTGQPDWTNTTTTDDSINVDPRITVAAHHFQVDNETLNFALNDTSRSMLSTSSGFIWTKLTAARGTGVNGLTVTTTMDPTPPGTTITASSLTANRGGEDGWTDRFDWVVSKPGGGWTKTLDITAPTTIDDNAHLVQGALQVFTLLAPDPRIHLRGYLNKQTGSATHFSAGEAMVANLTILDRVTNVRIDPTRVTEVSCTITRFRASDNRAEYLEADGTTWTLWEPTAAAPVIPMTATVGDPRVYTKAFSSTATWTKDILVDFFAKVDGTPYLGFSIREEVSADNKHSGYALDAVGLALSGKISLK